MDQGAWGRRGALARDVALRAALQKKPERFEGEWVQKFMNANTSGPNQPQRPAPEKVDEALHDVVEAERDRGDVNPGAEPDQKSEVQKPHDPDR